MARIQDILTKVRDTLSDPDGTRFSDSMLLRRMDTGQKLLVIKAKLLKKKIQRSILIGHSEYMLPSDCFRPTRILAKGVECAFKSHEAMDELQRRGVIDSDSNGGWEGVTGTKVDYIVYDKLNQNKFKVYPIITEMGLEFSNVSNDQVSETTASMEGFGEVTDSSSLEFNDYYGVVTAIEEGGVPFTMPAYGLVSEIFFDEITDQTDAVFGVCVGVSQSSMPNPYGIVSSFGDDGYTDEYYNENPNISGNYGLMCAFSENSDDLTIYYLKRPEEITLAGIGGDPEIGQEWDIALAHYISGMSLRNDKNTQNLTLSREELSDFYSILEEAQDDSSRDHTSNTQFEIDYQNPFDQ